MRALYVTKILSKDTKEIYIYISLEDFKKYAFLKEANNLIPYNDRNLLDTLNNVDGIMYRTPNINKDEKNKLTIKQKVQKALAILGVTVTMLTIEPAAVELVSYSLKTLKGTAYSKVLLENTSSEDFVNQFSIAINKNDDYENQEKRTIIEGFEKYFNDWGYLLDERDQRYILHMIENVNINRNVTLPPWAAGSYALGNISTETDADTVSNISHETAHALSDRGLALGTTNGLGFGYALNEGINTSVNDFYYRNDHSYFSQREDVLMLSLLVDDETLIEAYQKKGPLYLCSIMSKESDINYFDAIKYVSMMDIELFIDHYKVFGEDYSLPNSFYQDKIDLYKKMFKQKYDYDFSETVLGNISRKFQENFLDPIYELTREEKVYLVPKNVLSMKKDEIDLELYLQPQYSVAHLLLAPKVEEVFSKQNSWEDVCSYVANGKVDEETYNKIKSIFSDSINNANFDSYMELLTDKITNLNSSPEFLACYIKKALEFLEEQKVDNLENRFNQTIVQQLESKGLIEALDLYQNSTIEFEGFNLQNYEDYKIIDEYYKLYESKDFFLTEEGEVIVRTKKEERIWDGYFNGESLWFREIYDFEMPYYNISDSTDYNYYEAFFSTEQYDINDIKIITCKKVKTNEDSNLIEHYK